ncbi:transcriptional regulator with AAA-type ATPase domain/transcriptional regulatory protein LevR [Sporomusaceae bacterium BoRhaA]|uniref:sigma-54-dependent transcriptional regulator n=1 Tax=Pelorhabdus rhamnosifermentans TaxID=2772457 RepID=UPI001C060451|nr:sigma-54-dependent transcriptional regulator [Pelorhabdus rhamnosifermentans]MBU2699719.1 transcriptional regulator with AAA-type ATPase domain/transcriptional regulatory protein LevR [Pelorhabdus rhamnosifermentans]
MKRIEHVFEMVKELCEKQYVEQGQRTGISTDAVASRLGIQRSNASGDLNDLVKTGRLEKIEGKPVLYKIVDDPIRKTDDIISCSILDDIIGANKSLKNAIQQAKAAIMYPPLGLHTLLLGETGVGKSMFAEAIFRYARDIGRLKANAPFIEFNCADYAHNPQLLLAQLFGVKKGSYTGAERDRIGLVEKANHGILFLDEVHRLPPEGQEMLFYLIDKGAFRSMGEIEAHQKVEILIICATTENTDSVLLRTFTRRIPMIIQLPSIRERSMSERWELIKCFFQREALCLKVPIGISQNSLRAFLLYDCVNNIGQLKSDIKLSCAKAFLDYVGSKEKMLKVRSEDLPKYIRQGFVNYKEHRGELDKIGVTRGIVFQVSQDSYFSVEDTHTDNIYEVLEEKMMNLKSKGLSEEDIQLIMSLDMDTYIKKYMSKFRQSNLEELYKIVDRKVVEVTQEFLQYAAEKLERQYNDKILFGMCIHISSTLERIREGKEILNPHLAEIQKLYSREYSVANYFSSMMKKYFGVQASLSEIGFITMFLVFDDYLGKAEAGRVGVIVAMHGASTATSMAEVANRLLGEKYVVGYDMPLDQRTEIALEEITKLVELHNEGHGIIMLVDMGSLVMFGDMIYERTEIPIKTVEMVSTPMVLEATRKALMKMSLEDIYYAVTNLSPYIGRMHGNTFSHQLKDSVIVTACITGKGTAIKLKNMIEKLLCEQGRKVDVIPIEISDMEDFERKLTKVSQEKNLIAVVSSIKPRDKTMKYISTKQLVEGKLDLLLSGTAMDSLPNELVLEQLQFMQDVISENLAIDGKQFMQAWNSFYLELKKHSLVLSEEAGIGLIMHLACVVEKLTHGEIIEYSKRTEPLDRNQYGGSCKVVEISLQALEESFHINLADHEYENVVKLIYYL